MATLTYATADASLPKEVVVKFSPPELKTQLTMNIFLLSKAEYLAYTQFHASLPKSIKTPTCFGADFVSTTAGDHHT